MRPLSSCPISGRSRFTITTTLFIKHLVRLDYIHAVHREYHASPNPSVPLNWHSSMLRKFAHLGFALFIIAAFDLAGCGGGGGGSPPPPAWHNVTLSWNANREKGVNSPGGGYTISISGQSAPTPINVPYVSGLTAPTSTTVSLYTGTYSATVTAYATLDATVGVLPAPLALLLPP